MTIAFRASASKWYGSADVRVAYQDVVIPASVQVGDLLVMYVSTDQSSVYVVNGSNVTNREVPAGWTERLSVNGVSGNPNSIVATRTAVAGDAGSTVRVYYQASNHAATGTMNVTVAAYSNAAFGSVVHQGSSVSAAGPVSKPIPSISAGSNDRIVLIGAQSHVGTGTSSGAMALSAGSVRAVTPMPSYSMAHVVGDVAASSPTSGPWTATSTGGTIAQMEGIAVRLTDTTPPPPPPAPPVVVADPEQLDTTRKPWPVITTARRRGWRYFATRLNGDGTETMVDMDLPLADVSIQDVLSGDQALNCKIDPVYTRLLAADGQPILNEWGTAIYAEMDGDIRYGGILIDSGFNGPEWSLETVGFTGYLRGLPYTGAGYKGVKVDPLDVVRIIWGHAQSQQGGNIGMVLDGTTTNGEVLIGSTLTAGQYDPTGAGLNGLELESQAFKLNFYTNHDLADDIDQLAAATPFDYHERHFWNPDGTIGHHLDIGYKKIGRKRNDLRFIYGVNVFDNPSEARDGEIYASGSLVLGAGEGAAMIKSLREPPTRPAGRLRRIAVVVDDTIKTQARADRRADAENQWRNQLEDIAAITVVDHPNARLGEAKVGDTIVIQGRGDWTQWNLEVRILQISYSPADGGKAEYTIARTDKLV